MINLKKRLIQKIKYELGIDELEIETDSLLYVLNHCIDLTKIPPSHNANLRILQKCDTMLLAIFDKLCQRHGLDYWLNYGTILGAYRHKGFIPWDDDLDITMPREHLNKVMSLMKTEIEGLGLSIRYSYMHPLRCLVLGYNAEQTGIWVDLFPVDIYRSGASEEQLIEAMKQYRFFFNQNKNLNAEALTKKKNEIIIILY